MDMGFGFSFLLSRMLFYIVPILMFVIIGMGIIRTFREWHHNENSPRLTVEAKIVCKRSDYRRTMNSRKHHYSGSRTNYFVTFEVESGDRMELELQGHEYGLLVEGDKGKLTFQGTRYLGFERMI
mgnify:CR=1 FL=1